MKSLDEHIKRIALSLVLADLMESLKDTWTKINKNIHKFKEMIEPFIKRYLDSHTSFKDLSDLKKAVLRATDNAVGLIFENGKWTPHVTARTSKNSQCEDSL